MTCYRDFSRHAQPCDRLDLVSEARGLLANLGKGLQTEGVWSELCTRS